MSSAMDPAQKYILGLDLGSASVGWAVILLDQNENPCKLLAAGAHIFDPGVEKPPAVGQMSQDELILRGLDRSKAVRRRIARQQRRQIDRRALRIKKLFKLLQSKDLLPTYPEYKTLDLAGERCELFAKLDCELSQKLRQGKTSEEIVEIDQALPYVLRKEALERKLDRYELGRALYHLCQRRGYRPSQVKESEDEDEESTTSEVKVKKGRKKKEQEESEEEEQKEPNHKKVQAAILDLHTKMQAVGAQTYAAYFANFVNNNPHIEGIRKHWTSRDKYIEEFNLIWNGQRERYRETEPDLLNDDLRKQIYDCLFYQRPLASAAHLIGRCELIPEARRAPWATLEAQRFRLLQKVGDLAYLCPGEENEKSLSREEQTILAEALETHGDMSFKQIAELLSLPADTHFNLPRGKKDQKGRRIPGNRINHLMLRIFGERWTNDFTADQQQRKVVNSWATPADREARIEEAKTRWGLDETANLWADEKPPKDYCKFSLAALRQLNAGMEQGIHWTTMAAEMRSRIATKEPMRFVPPVEKALPAITNPAVLRALTELRKVVNAIIRKYHRPYEIRIELARELRKNRKQRHDAHQAAEKNHDQRMKAAQKILDECKAYEHNSLSAERLVREQRDDVTKMLLHMECGGICPYTGRCIPYHALFGDQVEVEHIIPASLLVDNDFGNLTLCYREVNADKLNRTPWQAFGPHIDPDAWDRIIERVKKFDNKAKLARFNLRSIEEVKTFASRRLNDTRYTSKLAGRLLMNLYADRDTHTTASDDPLDEFRDRSGRQPIKVSSGTVTSLLRDAWQLHLGGLIGDDAYKCPVKEQQARQNKKRARGQGGKQRCDHRHHALDAVVIALTSDRVVHEINTLAGRLYKECNRPLIYRDLKSVQSPWPGFINEEFRDVFRKMKVSRRAEHKLSGALHDQTFYPKIRPDGFRHQRVSLTKLSAAKSDESEFKFIEEKIVDEGIRQAILRFRKTIGSYRKWSPERDGWPQLDRDAKGNLLPRENVRPIKKVRIRINKEVATLGKRRSDRHVRYVEEGEIAYVSFFTVQTRKGTCWREDIVTRLGAAERLRKFPKALRGSHRISEEHADYPDATFRFHLMKGDLVELVYEGKKQIFVVRSFESDRRISIAPINAAGKQQDMERAGTLKRLGFAEFLMMGPGEDKVPQPVYIDLLGDCYNIAIKA